MTHSRYRWFKWTTLCLILSLKELFFEGMAWVTATATANDKNVSMHRAPLLAFASSVSAECLFIVQNTTLYRKECFNSTPHILRKILVTGSGGCGTHHAVDVFKSGGVTLKHEEIGAKGSSSWVYAVNDAVTQGWYRKFPSLTGDSKALHPGYVWGPVKGQKGIYDHNSTESILLDPRFEFVFHQTRCPLLNIDALLTHGKESAMFIAAALNLGEYLPSNECFEHKSRIKNEKHLNAKKMEAKLVSLQDCDVNWAMMVYYRWNLFIESFATHRYRVENLDSNIQSLIKIAGLTYKKTIVKSKKTQHYTRIHHKSKKQEKAPTQKSKEPFLSKLTHLLTKKNRRLTGSGQNHRVHVHGSPNFYKKHNPLLWGKIASMAERYGYGFADGNSTECIMLQGKYD